MKSFDIIILGEIDSLIQFKRKQQKLFSNKNFIKYIILKQKKDFLIN